MSTKTLLARFLQQACDEAAGQQDAAADIATEEMHKMIAKFHQFELLDDVADEFFDNNTHQGTHYTFEDLAKIARKKAFKFTHLGIPYLATVFRYEGPDTDWLNIKLPNDGFVYKPKEGRQQCRHMSQGWVALPKDKFLPYMVKLRARLEKHYDGVSAFYNLKQQRFDMKFFPAEGAPAGTPHLIVTYEPGYPDHDDQAEVYSLR